jgi:hypothetical protein
MAGSDHSGAISTDHLVRISQEKRKDDPGQGKDQENNLKMARQLVVFSFVDIMILT